jgi:hypothetical protein
VGTEDQPFLNKAVITLHGNRWKDVEIPGESHGTSVVSRHAHKDGQVRHEHGGGRERVLRACVWWYAEIGAKVLAVANVGLSRNGVGAAVSYDNVGTEEVLS